MHGVADGPVRSDVFCRTVHFYSLSPCDCRERRYGGSEHGRSRTASFLPSAGDKRTTFLTSSWLHRGQMNVRSSNPGSGAWMAVIHSGQWQTGQGGRSMSTDAGRKSEPVSMPEPGPLGFRASSTNHPLETEVDSAGKWLNSRGLPLPPAKTVCTH